MLQKQFETAAERQGWPKWGKSHKSGAKNFVFRLYLCGKMVYLCKIETINMDSCKSISINWLSGINEMPLSTEAQKTHLQQLRAQC